MNLESLKARLREVVGADRKRTQGEWAASGSLRVNKINGMQIRADGLHVASLSNKADKPIDQKSADGSFIMGAANSSFAFAALIEAADFIEYVEAGAFPEKFSEDAKEALAKIMKLAEGK